MPNLIASLGPRETAVGSFVLFCVGCNVWNGYLRHLLWIQCVIIALLWVLWVAEDTLVPCCKQYLDAKPVAKEVEIGMTKSPYSNRVYWNFVRICLATVLICGDALLCVVMSECTESLLARLGSFVVGFVSFAFGLKVDHPAHSGGDSSANAPHEFHLGSFLDASDVRFGDAVTSNVDALYTAGNDFAAYTVELVWSVEWVAWLKVGIWTLCGLTAPAAALYVIWLWKTRRIENYLRLQHAVALQSRTHHTKCSNLLRKGNLAELRLITAEVKAEAKLLIAEHTLGALEGRLGPLRARRLAIRSE